MDEIEIAKAILVESICDYSGEPSVERYNLFRKKGYSPIASAILTNTSLKFGPVEDKFKYLEDKVK